MRPSTTSTRPGWRSCDSRRGSATTIRLWTDEDYATTTRYGGLIAPPSFIFCCLGSVQVGWRGLGGFHGETKLTFHKPIRCGDRITARVFFEGFEGPTESAFAGRRVKDWVRQDYYDQHGDLVAEFRPGQVPVRARPRRSSAPTSASSNCRIRGRKPSSPPSKRTSWPRRPEATLRASGTTWRSGTRWSRSPKARSG